MVTTIRARRALSAAFAAALLASCNGGGNGESPPLLGATPGAGATIYAFGGTGSPNEDGAEPKGTLTAVTIGGADGALRPHGDRRQGQRVRHDLLDRSRRHELQRAVPLRRRGRLRPAARRDDPRPQRRPAVRHHAGRQPDDRRAAQDLRQLGTDLLVHAGHVDPDADPRPSTRSPIRRRRRHRSTARSSTARSRSTRRPACCTGSRRPAARPTTACCTR